MRHIHYHYPSLLQESSSANFSRLFVFSSQSQETSAFPSPSESCTNSSFAKFHRFSRGAQTRSCTKFPMGQTLGFFTCLYQISCSLAVTSLLREVSSRARLSSGSLVRSLSFPLDSTLVTTCPMFPRRLLLVFSGGKKSLVDEHFWNAHQLRVNAT